MGKRIEKKMVFSKGLGKEVEITSFSNEFMREIDLYNSKARNYKEEVNKITDTSWIFNKKGFALNWLAGKKEELSKIEELYNNLLTELKVSKIKEHLLIKRQLPKINQVRFYNEENKKIEEIKSYELLQRN